MGDSINFKQWTNVPTIQTAISTVADGNMSFVWGERDVVDRNREAFLSGHHLPTENILAMRCDHQGKIVTIDQDAARAQNIITCDAFISNLKGLSLLVLTADCIPAVFYDPVNEVIALLHLSWKTTDSKLASRTITRMVEQFHSDPATLQVSWGPGIKPDSYQFEHPIQKTLPDWQPFLRELPNGQTSIDIFSYNRLQVVESGVNPSNIEDLDIDTATNTNFFSHYRSARTGEAEGRFATVVALL